MNKIPFETDIVSKMNTNPQEHIERVVGAPVKVDIVNDIIRLAIDGGWVGIGRIIKHDMYNGNDRKINWWYDWYTMREFIRGVLSLPDDGVVVTIDGWKITVRDNTGVHIYCDGAAKHEYVSPRWLGDMPAAFPAQLCLPTGDVIEINDQSEIPPDTFGVFGQNLYKFAYERGLRFRRADLNTELDHYIASEPNRAAVRAAVEEIFNAEHFITIAGIKLRLPRDTLLMLATSELEHFSAPDDDPDALVPFA